MFTLIDRFFNLPDQNCVMAVNGLLRRLNVPVLKKTISRGLKEHPYYPTILSVRDLLNNLKVENATIKAFPDQLGEISVPFLAQTHLEGKDYFTTVYSLDSLEVICMDETTGNKKRMRRQEFNRIYTGVAMVAEASPGSGEKNYKTVYRQSLFKSIVAIFATVSILILLGITISTTIAEAGWQAMFPLLLLVWKLAGSGIVILLLLHETDAGNPLLEKVCKTTMHVNCNAVLRSGAAKVGGIFSWSEMGLLYFAGGVLVLLTGNMDKRLVVVLAWLNFMTIPYVFFSVYYQWRIVKQWCVLCLAIQVVLVLELLTCLTGKLYFFDGSMTVSLINACRWTVLFVLPLLIWLLLKDYFLLPEELSNYRFSLARFKQNPDVLKALLLKQKKIVYNTEGLGITLGSPNASKKILKVCNLYCGPCSETHPDLEDILDKHDDVQVQIIFAVTNSEEDMRIKIANHLLAIASTAPEDVLRQALRDWYGMPRKNYDKFARKYPINGTVKAQMSKIDALYSWTLRMDINHTPAFFYNEYQLPPTHTIGDLKYFLTIGDI